MNVLAKHFLNGLLQLLGCLLVVIGINSIVATIKINNALIAGWCGNDANLLFNLSHCEGCLQALLGFTLLALLNYKKITLGFNRINSSFTIRALA